VTSSGLSIREYARHRRAAGLKGGTPSAVHKALMAGRIKRDPEGLIDPMQADAAWDATTDDTRGEGSGEVVQPRQVAPGARQSPPSLPAEPMPSPPAGGGTAPSYATSRAIREAYAARLAKITYEERSKVLVDAARVQAEAFRRARDTRDAVLAIPGRLAAILAADTDPVSVEAILSAELRAVLEAQANG
jgi:hypothetical protein